MRRIRQDEQDKRKRMKDEIADFTLYIILMQIGYNISLMLVNIREI
jgi:hypothetical protein